MAKENLSSHDNAVSGDQLSLVTKVEYNLGEVNMTSRHMM
jgi:hypothetical protein